MDMEINFPNLGIYLDHVGKNISIFGFSIAYYGIVIVTGMMIAIWIAQREAKRTGQNPEQYLDLAMIGIAAGILGARIYYVIFAWDYYKDDLLSIFNIRQGGLAIYGGIIGACIAVVIYSRKKKQNFSLLMDTASMSIVFGQIMGRWGNFFNREAFGDYTNNLFAMQLPVSAVRANEITQKMWDHVVTVNGVEYIQVHPTFLYESLWNVGVLLFLFWFRKRKKFNGEVFLMYLIGYGLGRIWIEGLRTDQLLLPVVGLPVSQLLSGCLVVGCTHLIPLVELTRCDKTDDDCVQLAYDFYQSIGKEAVLLRKECPGFIANRLQLALYREVQDLVMRGVCSVEDVDKALVYGPGIRWAIFGHNMIMQMGNPGGLTGMVEMLGNSGDHWLEDMASWTHQPDNWAQVAQPGVDQEMANFPDYIGHTNAECIAYRDQMLIDILKLHKKL